MKLKIWGTRGSIPVPGEDTIKYGGNTPCITIEAEGQIFIIDAGTGIFKLGQQLNSKKNYKNIKILLSHTHWDHIQGLPYFEPLYNEYFDIDIYSKPSNNLMIDQIIDRQLEPQFSPISREVFSANVNYFNITTNPKLSFGKIHIESIAVHHSVDTVAFKFTLDDKSIVYMTDNEILSEIADSFPTIENIRSMNKELINFCNGADFLIHDSMFNLRDSKNKRGWGHSDNISLANFAIAANVKNLILFHFDPTYNDQIVENLLDETKKILYSSNSDINCFASSEGESYTV